MCDAVARGLGRHVIKAHTQDRAPGMDVGYITVVIIQGVHVMKVWGSCSY
jgi:hypothetical protein